MVSEQIVKEVMIGFRTRFGWSSFDLKPADAGQVRIWREALGKAGLTDANAKERFLAFFEWWQARRGRPSLKNLCDFVRIRVAEMRKEAEEEAYIRHQVERSAEIQRKVRERKAAGLEAPRPLRTRFERAGQCVLDIGEQRKRVEEAKRLLGTEEGT